MPFKSKAQQRFLESKAFPLSKNQKEEWESSTDFKSLKDHVSAKASKKVKKK